MSKEENVDSLRTLVFMFFKIVLHQILSLNHPIILFLELVLLIIYKSQNKVINFYLFNLVKD